MVVVTYEGFFLRLVKSLRDPIVRISVYWYWYWCVLVLQSTGFKKDNLYIQFSNKSQRLRPRLALVALLVFIVELYGDSPWSSEVGAPSQHHIIYSQHQTARVPTSPTTSTTVLPLQSNACQRKSKSRPSKKNHKNVGQSTPSCWIRCAPTKRSCCKHSDARVLLPAVACFLRMA